MLRLISAARIGYIEISKWNLKTILNFMMDSTFLSMKGGSLVKGEFTRGWSYAEREFYQQGCPGYIISLSCMSPIVTTGPSEQHHKKGGRLLSGRNIPNHTG